MARKLTYDITRFDGGMTDNIRTNDLSKCAYVSHFDIYRDPNKMYPMPGYVSDEAISGDSDGLKDYNIKAFFYQSTLYAVGELLAGGGNKIWEKATPTTSEWTASTGGEGTYDLKERTFLADSPNSQRLYFITEDSGNTYVSFWNYSTVTDAGATLETFTQEYNHIAEYAFDDKIYSNAISTDAISLNDASITDPAKDTGARITDIESGDEQIGLIGYTFYPYKGRLLLWDSASSLIDKNIDFGNGIPRAVGFPEGTWVGVVDEGLTTINSQATETANGSYKMRIKYASTGARAKNLYCIEAKTQTNADIRPIRGRWNEAMIFYARVPQDATPTTYKAGVFAVGRSRADSPLAVSVLLDTTDLGSIEGVHSFGSHFFFAHNADGSVSRLDDLTSGTYDVTCIYESLMLGSNSPFLKEFKGLSVMTEDLPSGASVVAKYRFNEDDSWTTLATSSTTGKEVHNFTRAAGVPIGKFKEMQVRIEVTGNAPIKGIFATLVETDDLPFNH